MPKLDWKEITVGSKRGPELHGPEGPPKRCRKKSCRKRWELGTGMDGAQEGLNSHPGCPVFCESLHRVLCGAVLRTPHSPFSPQLQSHLSHLLGAGPQEGTMAKAAASGSLVLCPFFSAASGNEDTPGSEMLGKGEGQPPSLSLG